MEGVESVLLGPPHLVGFRFPVPLRAVVGKGVGEEEGGCGKCREPVVVYWKARPLGLFCASSIVMMNWGTWGSLVQYPWSFLIKVTTSVTSRLPIYSEK